MKLLQKELRTRKHGVLAHTLRVFLWILCIHFEYCSTSGSDEDDRTLNGCLRMKSSLTCTHTPKEIPIGIKSVQLRDIRQYGIKNGTFSSKSWGQVETLVFRSSPRRGKDDLRLFDRYCFTGLDNLKQLHISIERTVVFTNQTLIGLRNLWLLDVSRCPRFQPLDLISALSHPDAVPNIRTLNMSNLGSYLSPIKSTEGIFKIISAKRIKQLDISSIQILMWNVTDLTENCETLEYLDMSRVNINSIAVTKSERICPNLKYFDISYSFFPSKVMPDRGPHLENLTNEVIPVDFHKKLTMFQNLEYLNLAGIMPKDTMLAITNITAIAFGIGESRIKTVILRNNNLVRLDFKLIIQLPTLERIDLSNCKISFLNPGALSSFRSLTRLDLSDNHLNDMIIENGALFGKLFQNLTHLRIVNLARNSLSDIPSEMFINNPELETLDLSYNSLSQVSFDVKTLRNIKLINLTRNLIQVLDESSLTRLNNLLSTKEGIFNSTKKTALLLKGNPVACSKCESLTFVKWLEQSRTAIDDFSELQCISEQSKPISFERHAVHTVQHICNRPVIILVSCLLSASVCIIIVFAVLIIRRYWKQKKYMQEMDERIARIRQGADAHEFVVFLSYSSKDENFISEYVIEPLNEKLQEMTDVRRNLVSEGDTYFELGRPIHDEISKLLKRSSVVIVLWTNDYSQSIHCRNEIDQSFMLEKPIILMFKDEVDPGLMTPTIRDIYNTKTRIHWIMENGQFVLKTSWENVCTSVIELVDKD